MQISVNENRIAEIRSVTPIKLPSELHVLTGTSPRPLAGNRPCERFLSFAAPMVARDPKLSELPGVNILALMMNQILGWDVSIEHSAGHQ